MLRHLAEFDAIPSTRRQRKLFAPALEPLENRTLLNGGGLDPTFGSGGVLVHDFGNTQLFFAAHDVARQPDGKIVVVGESGFVARFNADGSVDNSFGIEGRAPFQLDFNDTSVARAIVVLPDGKIVVGGGAKYTWPSPGAFALERYNPDGTPDTSFGDGGRVLTTIGYSASIHALAIQPDGKIVAGGESVSTAWPALPEYDFTLARYEPDGRLDTTFGASGTVVVNFLDPGVYRALADTVEDLVVLADGSIIAVGTTDSWGGSLAPGRVDSSRAVVARFRGDGTFDASLNDSASILADWGPNTSANAVAVQGDGKILVAGEYAIYSNTNYVPSGAALTRYNQDGSLDLSFNGTGRVVLGGPNTWITLKSLLVGPNATILTAGTTSTGEFLLEEFDAAGNSIFSATAPIGYLHLQPAVAGMVLQPDGKVLLIGSTNGRQEGEPSAMFFTAPNQIVLSRFVLPDHAGMPDPTFGTDGFVINEVNDPSHINNWLFAIQPDGKFVEIGHSRYDSPAIQLFRHNPDGSSDMSFGSGGAAPFPAGLGAPAALAIQSDGKIVVAGAHGYSSYGFCNGQFGACTSLPLDHPFVARFNADGTIDTTFGEQGSVVTSLGRHSWISDLVVQPDGKIVAGGTIDGKFLVLRYTSDGTLDTQFGDGGTVVTSFGLLRDTDRNAISGVALQPDGRIVVAGTYESPTRTAFRVPSDIAVARYNADGTLDATFGDGGIVRTAIGEDSSWAHDIVVEADGDLVVLAGAHSGGNETAGGRPYSDGDYVKEIALLRYKSDGRPDPTFGGDGHVLTNIRPSWLWFRPSVNSRIPFFAVQSDGKILVTGPRGPLARFDENGALDLTFGDSGRVYTNRGPETEDTTGLALQADGKIIVANGLTLSRYLNDGLPLVVALPRPTTAVLATGSDAGASPQVDVFNADTNALLFTLTPFDPNFTGGVRTAVGDVNGDNTPDILCAAGTGGGPHVVVYSGADGAVLYSFFAFSSDFTGGVNIAAGDVNGDGFADIICGAGAGGGPNVAVYNGKDGSLLQSFYAFDPEFTGGVSVAAGDVMGAGETDLICGAGPGGGPNVTVFNSNGTMLASFYANDPGLVTGVCVSAGAANGDGPQAIIADAHDGTGAPVVFSLDVVQAGIDIAWPPVRSAVDANDGDSDTEKQLDAFFAADPLRMGSLFIEDVAQ